MLIIVVSIPGLVILTLPCVSLVLMSASSSQTVFLLCHFWLKTRHEVSRPPG